jgi:hypothetical protein
MVARRSRSRTDMRSLFDRISPYAAAVNYPPLDELLAQVRVVHRQESDCVRFILRTQHEDRARSVAA